MYFSSNKPRSFGGISFFDYKHEQSMKIKKEIEDQDKDYILSIDENEYKEFLYEKYKLEPLTIHTNEEQIDAPRQIKITRNERGEDYEVNGYEFRISYPYEGSSVLFQLSPTQRILTGHEIRVESSLVSFVLKIDKHDPEHFNRQKEQARKNAFANAENINKDVISWNNELTSIVSRYFSEIKNRYVSENAFFEAINVKVDQNTKSVFSVPTIQKKSIPQPKAQKKEFTSEPSMNSEMYQDTLKVIYDFGRSMERKPSLYKGKNEEDICDLFVAIMETRYDSTTVTGETFNKGGKTDILLKYQDGTNLFVAECKWWKGEKEFSEAINQLFDNYLTWRDSKTALLFFVKNKEIATVCEKIKLEAMKHPYYLDITKDNIEGRYSFKFHLPGDKNKEVFLEIMAFHFNEV